MSARAGAEAETVEDDRTPAPRRRRGREVLVSVACLTGWMTALMLLAAFGGNDATRSVLAGAGMVGLFAAAWALGARFVDRGMVFPPAILGIVGPVALGYALPLLNRGPGLLSEDHWPTMICAGAALGMTVFLFRLRLAALVSPIITFTVIALFLGLRGASPEAIRELEGFSPRGILAALVGEPVYMAVFGTLALAALAFARWLDLTAQEFGMRSAKPLHIVGAGVTALICGRLAAALPTPADLAVLAILFALAMAWALRVDRLAVMATAFFALARPLILTLLPLTGGTMDHRDWIVAHMAVLGVGFFLWPVIRKRTVRAGFTRRPRYITWNWPDRVIFPYRPPPGHR